MSPPQERVSARELSPAQHALIRRQIALIPVYIWTVYAWSLFVVHLPTWPAYAQTHVARDFVHFYAQGVITREHDAHALYDLAAMARVVDRVVPVKVEAQFPPVYGPQVGLFFLPFAYIPYLPAMVLWLALSIAGFAACVYLVWRTCPTLQNERLTVLILALGAAGLHFTLSFAQVSVIGLACFTAIWLALRSGRPFLAGLAVGTLAYKPQLGIVAAFVFVLSGEWRVVAGAIASVAIQLIAGLAYWGPSIYRGYLSALLKLPTVIEAMEPDKQLMHSWRSLCLQVGLPAGAALWTSLVLSAATSAVAVVTWRRGPSLAGKFVVLILATFLVDPHVYAYELLLLTPALLVAWDWANSSDPGDGVRARSGLLVAFLYAAPLVTIALPFIPLQWSVVGFLLLGGVCVREAWIRESPQSGVQRVSR